MDSALTPMQQAVYDTLRRDARLGRVCPSMRVLVEICGAGAITSIDKIMCSLMRKGLIHIEGKGSERVVMIVATGECTARPAITQPKPQAMSAPVRLGAAPCFHCGSRPDACMCGRRG